MRRDREPVLVCDIGGLKCDAAGCGWRDDDVTLEEYPAYLDAACPVCGANVLTQHDLTMVARMVRMVAFVNRWLWWLPKGKRPGKAYAVELDGKSHRVREIDPSTRDA